jgi:hypothetical protein
LDGVPFRARHCGGVTRPEERRAFDAGETLEILEFTREHEAVAKARQDRATLHDLRLCSKERAQHVFFAEVIGEKIAHVAADYIGKSFELEARNTTAARLDLGHGRSGDAKFSGDVGLSERGELPRGFEATGEIFLGKGHGYSEEELRGGRLGMDLQCKDFEYLWQDTVYVSGNLTIYKSATPENLA